MVNVSASNLGIERFVFVSHFAHRDDYVCGLTFLLQIIHDM